MMKKEKIIVELRKLEKEHNIKIILAVESGSREWGFASEDSDYDVRCVHVSKSTKYLDLSPPDEQIEKMTWEIDIVSWDIRKFLRLFIKSNPSVSEWLCSETIYRDCSSDSNLSQHKLRILFQSLCNFTSLQKHYISLARQNYSKYIDKATKVQLKKYVYILRGLGCVEYIKKEKTLPPLDWKKSSKYLPINIRKKFESLVEMKKKSEETLGHRDEEIDRWIEDKLNQKVIEFKSKEIDEKTINSLIYEAIGGTK